MRDCQGCCLFGSLENQNQVAALMLVAGYVTLCVVDNLKEVENVK
jgi:hypothetical protein